MKNIKIYNKTLCFVWPRVPLSVVGTFLAVLLPTFIVLILIRIFSELGPGLVAFIVIVCVYAANAIGKLGTKKARVSQIAMMTRGIVYGTLPDNIKKEAYRVARYHFDDITTADLLRSIMRKRIILKDARNSAGGDEKVTPVSILADIRSFLFIFVVNLIPYGGDCVLAWQFAYPGRTFSESVCDSVETMLRNWLRMLLLLLFLIVNTVLCYFIVALIATGIVMLLEGRFEILDRFFNFLFSAAYGLNGYKEYGDNVVYAFFSILAVGLINPFFRSGMRIRVFRQFFKASDKHPPTGALFERYGKTIKKWQKKAENEDD